MNLALFDFDGTITTRDTFTPFLRFAVPASRVVVGGVLISPVLLASRLRLIANATARPIVASVGFGGRTSDTVRALGRQYASDVLPSVIDARVMERVEWHRRQGDTVAVVSAGLDVYLEPWCREHGLNLICTELEERRGRLTGRYRRGDCSGPTKALLVRDTFELAVFDAIYAYGDSPEDREMLALAHHKYYRGKELTRADEMDIV